MFRRKITSAKNAFRARLPSKFHRQLIHQHHLQFHLHCGNDPTVANHNGILSTAHARKTLETPFTMRNRSDHGPKMIRPWSENDPTTYETVSHPSHRRDRSSTFGDVLCLEKHRVSCICYLSKIHFMRDFLQNSICNSSTSTTCNPIYSEGTILGLQITMEFHRQLIHQHHLQSHLHCRNDPTVTNHNGILSTANARNTGETPFTMRNRSDHGPKMIRPWSENDPTTHETVSHPSHRRGRSSTFGDALCLEKHRVSYICYLLKTHFVRDFLQNSSTSTTCNPIYSEGTILELQITMEFHRQLIHQHHLQSHLHCRNDPTIANHNGILSTANTRNTGETPFTMRNRSEHDPNMIRPWSENNPTTHETVSHPSHRRGRSSTFGDALCLEKHRVSCICYLSKIHFVRDFLQNSIGNSSTSTTCNPIYSEGTSLELQITIEFHRQLIHQHHLQSHLHCGNDPTVANHNGILSTANARNTGETPFTMRNRSEHDPNMIRPWSENNPTTHETVSHPSHRRGRSSTFGDVLCLEKHRVSCICYLSKIHFVRDFLQNSIGNSSTSTTCNPIYSEGTSLELQITIEFHRQLIHQHHLQSHLHCGNDPTVTNHNGILSTANARNTGKPHLQCGTAPRPIREWSNHTRDRLAPVAPQR